MRWNKFVVSAKTVAYFQRHPQGL